MSTLIEIHFIKICNSLSRAYNSAYMYKKCSYIHPNDYFSFPSTSMSIAVPVELGLLSTGSTVYPVLL